MKKVKCQNCKAELTHVVLSVFNYDGTDGGYRHPLIKDSLGEGVIYVETNPNWVGYELDEEELSRTVVCPHCGEYPFENKEIVVDEVVRVSFSIKQEKKNPESEMMKLQTSFIP